MTDTATVHDIHQGTETPADGSEATLEGDGTGQALPPATDGEQLFDATDYDREDLQIPKVDNQTVDKIRLDFAGSIMLDRSDPADVALFNRAILGKPIELRCSGKVSGSGAGFTTNKEGDLDAVVAKKTVKVDTVWVLEPEQL